MSTRIMTINLRKYLSTQPRTRRIKRSMRYLRERIAHYTKTDESKVSISDELNRAMFKHYIKSMKPLKVSVDISEGKAKVGLFKDASKAAAPASPKPAQGQKPKQAEKEKGAAKPIQAKAEGQKKQKAPKPAAPASSGQKSATEGAPKK